MDDTERCDICGGGVDRSRTYVSVTVNCERMIGDEIEVEESEEIAVLCSRSCLERYRERIGRADGVQP